MARGRREYPVEETSIRDVTLDGKGVASANGKTVFVDAALTNERVRYRIRKRKKNFDEAELVEVLESSKDRVDPVCPNFGVCGGCALQHLSAEAQLALKQQSLFDALARIGRVEAERIVAPLAGRLLGYRRRARIGARYVPKKGRLLVGFREKNKPYIADMQVCETLVPVLASLIEPLSAFIASLELYTQVPQIEMSAGDDVTALIFRVLEEPGAGDLQKFREFAVTYKLQLWLQTGGPATVRPLAEDNIEALAYDLPEFDLRLEYGPLDFVQVNQDMNRRMLSQAVELLAPKPGEHILDLYCGIGNFSLPLARLGANVVGVELDTRMVEKATVNAALNGIQNAAFFTADLALPEQEQEWWRQDYSAVLIDPPRAGALEALPKIAATGVGRVLYVSCHPGSLARDAGVLVHDYGFRLAAAGVMDMFPQTSHVEAMALFVRDAV